MIAMPKPAGGINEEAYTWTLHVSRAVSIALKAGRVEANGTCPRIKLNSQYSFEKTRHQARVRARLTASAVMSE